MNDKQIGKLNEADTLGKNWECEKRTQCDRAMVKSVVIKN